MSAATFQVLADYFTYAISASPAGCDHRSTWQQSDCQTVWLQCWPLLLTCASMLMQLTGSEESTERMWDSCYSITLNQDNFSVNAKNQMGHIAHHACRNTVIFNMSFSFYCSTRWVPNHAQWSCRLLYWWTTRHWRVLFKLSCMSYPAMSWAENIFLGA